MRSTKVMIVDDHEVVRMGLRSALEPEDDIEVVADVGDAQAAMREAEIHRPDVVLMDVRMPGTDGIEACRRLREELPETRVVMLTSYSDEDAVFASIMAGAAGYLLKNTSRAELLSALRVRRRRGVAPGPRRHLSGVFPPEGTDRQGAVLGAGLSFRARERGSGPGRPGHDQPGDRGSADHKRTYGPQSRQPHPELGLGRRSEAASFATRHGLVDPPKSD